MKPLPSADYLRECFDYDPDTGVVTWRQRPLRHFKNSHGYNIWNTQYAHTRLHSMDGRGYWRVAINGQRFSLHRVIFKLMTGRDADPEVDHINGVKTDNRWSNLREATSTQNKHNSCGRAPHKLKGVFQFNSRRFTAQIVANGKVIRIGNYDTEQEAHAAYRAAAEKLHGEFCYYKRSQS